MRLSTQLFRRLSISAVALAIPLSLQAGEAIPSQPKPVTMSVPVKRPARRLRAESARRLTQQPAQESEQKSEKKAGPTSAEQKPSQPEAAKEEKESKPRRISLGKKKKSHRTAEGEKIGKRKTRKGRSHRKGKQRITKKSCSSTTAAPSYAIKAISPSGKTLTTTDETVWEVSPSYARRVASWPNGSSVVIFPNNGFTSWFSSYDYLLHNVATNQSAEADLSQGPFVKHSVLTRQLDRQTGLIVLSDGSTWTVGSASDLRKLQRWKLDQAVLFGKNNEWFGPSFILININLNEYLPVNYRG